MATDPASFCSKYNASEATFRLCLDLLQLGAADPLPSLVASNQNDANNFFLIWASSLVIFMHAGFAMLSAGAVRTKNTKNILLSIVMDMTVCAVAWYLVGYAFAFGQDRDGFIGTTFWVGIDVGAGLDSSNQVPGGGSPATFNNFSTWLFEYAFAATAATIVSGAIAERARFDTYLIYSFFISAWVYPIVVHWVWGGGFLTLGNPNNRSLMGFGVVDFAGCGPVHMVGGLAGAIAAKIMGPRIGRFDPETGKAIPIPGHSSPLATLGTFILWVGWIGFNCGSVVFLSPGSPNLENGGAFTPGNGAYAARAGVNTILSSSTGALGSLFLARLLSRDGDYDIGMALNGALAGLVSITGCCPYVEMWAAICIGLIGGIVYVGSSRLTLNVLKIDDPLDATPVHLFCGMWGIIAGTFFAVPHLMLLPFPLAGLPTREVPQGVFYGGNTVFINADGSYTAGSVKGPLVAAGVVEICSIFAWVTCNVTPLFLFLNKMGVLRVAPDVEAQGLDVSHHGGGAYPDLFHAWNFDPESRKAGTASSEAPKPAVAESIPAPVQQPEVEVKTTEGAGEVIKT